MFYSDRGGDVDVWTVPTAGGTPRPLTHQKTGAARWAPDGRSITYSDRRGLWTIPAEGGAPVQLVAAEHVSNHNWSRDGRTIYYRRQDGVGQGSIWAVGASGGVTRPVLRLDDPTRHPDREEFGVEQRTTSCCR